MCLEIWNISNEAWFASTGGYKRRRDPIPYTRSWADEEGWMVFMVTYCCV
jgi:hypothetical protein